jgi:phosphoglycolate phosphatase-like HAD superfamily hydrolase
MKRRLYLFDIDCTLLWTRGAGREAMRHAMLEVFGTNDGIDDHYFGGKTDWISLIELLTPRGFTPHEIERRIPAYDRAMGVHLECVIGTFDVTPCPGALDLITYLHQHEHAELALVTGNCRSSAPIKLRAAGFDPALFAVGAYGSEAIERDHLPPLALRRAVEHFRHPYAPGDVVVIGDTPADVQCGRALGALTVAVHTGFCKPGELAASQPDILLDDLTTFIDHVLS